MDGVEGTKQGKDGSCAVGVEERGGKEPKWNMAAEHKSCVREDARGSGCTAGGGKRRVGRKRRGVRAPSGVEGGVAICMGYVESANQTEEKTSMGSVEGEGRGVKNMKKRYEEAVAAGARPIPKDKMGKKRAKWKEWCERAEIGAAGEGEGVRMKWVIDRGGYSMC